MYLDSKPVQRIGQLTNQFPRECEMVNNAYVITVTEVNENVYDVELTFAKS